MRLLSLTGQMVHADGIAGGTVMSRIFLAALILLVPCSAPARAAQVCAWLVESSQPLDVRMLTLWLQSDADIDFLYKIDGDGIVTEAGSSNSPTTATYNLHAGHADSPWHYGSTLEGPGKIDLTVEIRKTPIDIFSEKMSPLLARFVFKRTVPATEKTPPASLASRQCAELMGAN
jgi:hypothetical protein